MENYRKRKKEKKGFYTFDETISKKKKERKGKKFGGRFSEKELNRFSDAASCYSNNQGVALLTDNKRLSTETEAISKKESVSRR